VQYWGSTTHDIDFDIPSMRVDSMPYGGVKNSGLGREGIRFAIQEMTEIRLLVLNRIGEEESVN
jgi:acyl-CoA reductase-like NAD-dependent aldehyde dehydrogenase